MYSPKIEPQQVRQLYFIKIAYVEIGIKKPMTEIVREALEQYIPKVVKKIEEAGGSLDFPDELTGD